MDEERDYGEVRVSTGGVDLPIQIRDNRFRLITEGLGSETHRLPPGKYLVAAQLPGSDKLVAALEAFAGQTVDVDLSPPPASMTPSPREYMSAAAGDLGTGESVEIERLGVPPAPTAEPSPANPLWALNFYVAKGGMRYEPAGAAAVRAEVVEEGGATVRMKLSEAAVGAFLVQAEIAGQVPLNIVLPLGPGEGGCELTARIVGSDVVLGAYPAEPRAMLAARFLAAGDVHEGSQVITSDQAEGMVQAKGRDPVGATIAAYLLLRMGELERLHDWPTNLAKVAWLPDGAIIAAETAALHGDYAAAVSYLTAAVERGLPIFTDGYSILASRLRQLGRLERQTAEPTTLPGRLVHSWLQALPGRVRHTSTGSDDLVPRHIKRAAHHMLLHVLEWAPFIDFAAPTLTFRAASPTDPAKTQTAVDRPSGSLRFRGTVQLGQSSVDQTGTSPSFA
jgi:hypothetical protein